MSLVLSLGTNIGDRLNNLSLAKIRLDSLFEPIEHSSIYQSKAVDFEDQPDFLNQILVYKLPDSSPIETLKLILSVEAQMGRVRDIPKGPRIIDIDILFWELASIKTKDLTVPHPRLFERSFIVKPLKELKYFDTLSKNFHFKNTFCNAAFPFKST